MAGEMVHALLDTLKASSAEEMSEKLLLMSHSPQMCAEMKQFGCVPILVQFIHNNENIVRTRATHALRNIVAAETDESVKKRDQRVLRLLEDVRAFVDVHSSDHPNASMSQLMRMSFDQTFRHVMCSFGAVHAIAHALTHDHHVHNNEQMQQCVTLRRISAMALTNLTFNDATNKSILCAMRAFMTALVQQLSSSCEELRQVTASLLRNLSCRADFLNKQILRECGAVTQLTHAALTATKESTLRSILVALWNLSAHCAPNKEDICAVNGALEFLVSTLTYTSNTLTVVENGGGILRNISSHVAIHEKYRAILRTHNCIAILLEHLKSPSLTIVSNACATLFNLSARDTRDQQLMYDLGACQMLKSLVSSKHKMISMFASATLKNLLTADIEQRAPQPSSSPLHARKMKALKAFESELMEDASVTCDEPTDYSQRYKESTDDDQMPITDSVRVYQTEGTPLTFSLSSSLTDLCKPQVPPKPKRLELKSVSFNATPLMFSRTSSLGSVDTCNTHEGSLQSEFSRRASGVVSPSELPDSPGHSVPSTPKQEKRTAPDGSFLESDSVHVFVTEDTPALLSNATSISELRINDEDEDEQMLLRCIEQGMPNKPLLTPRTPASPTNTKQSSSDDDDAMLELVISKGMPKKRELLEHVQPPSVMDDISGVMDLSQTISVSSDIFDDDDDDIVHSLERRLSPVGSEDFILDTSDDDSRATYHVSSPRVLKREIIVKETRTSTLRRSRSECRSDSSSTSSNGTTTTCASFPRKFEVQSRIASLWKRNKNENKNDLNRNVQSRRSFSKKSHTFERKKKDKSNNNNNNNNRPHVNNKPLTPPPVPKSRRTCLVTAV